MEHFWIIYSWKLQFSLIIYYMEFLDIVAWIFSIYHGILLDYFGLFLDIIAWIISISWNTIGILLDYLTWKYWIIHFTGLLFTNQNHVQHGLFCRLES